MVVLEGVAFSLERGNTVGQLKETANLTKDKGFRVQGLLVNKDTHRP